MNDIEFEGGRERVVELVAGWLEAWHGPPYVTADAKRGEAAIRDLIERIAALIRSAPAPAAEDESWDCDGCGGHLPVDRVQHALCDACDQKRVAGVLVPLCDLEITDADRAELRAKLALDAGAQKEE